tara:strand:- start:237 stop:485 length:249 start_codon:yes stop_codon:yes gene_type:complete
MNKKQKAKKFADYLIWYRVDNHLSRKEFASKLLITEPTLKRWETGKANMSRHSDKVRRAWILIAYELEFKLLQITKELGDAE